MPPVGLLALAAFGLVLLYLIPDRIRDTGGYALLNPEGPYRANLEAVRTSASRLNQAPAPSRKRSKGLASREAKASIKALGHATMPRPAAPLDRAATVAHHQLIAIRRDHDRTAVRRAAQARRRAAVGLTSLVVAGVAWGFVAASTWPLWTAVAASSVFGGSAVAGRRAVRAQRKEDVRLIPVAREVVEAATATAALRRIAVERAAGHQAQPSDTETQAIEVVTNRLAAIASEATPLVDPAPVPHAAPPRPAAPRRSPEWSPGMLPIPAYTLKPAAPPRTPKQIDKADLEADAREAEAREAEARAARRAALEREVAMAPEMPVIEAEASTQTLEDILARRRFRSA